MQTFLKSGQKTVVIDTEGPLVIIGEKINPTGRKKIAAALQTGDFDYIKNLALSQIAAGRKCWMSMWAYLVWMMWRSWRKW